MLDTSKLFKLTQEEYDDREGWRSTRLTKMAVHSVAHALVPYTSTKSMDLGSLVHTSVLEPHLLDNLYVLPEDANLTKNPWKTIKAEKEAEGFTVIKHEVAEGYKGCHEQLLKCVDITGKPLFQNHVKNSRYTNIVEPSIFWKDPRTGLNLKVRPDYVRFRKNSYDVIEIKTTSKDSVDGVSKSIIDYVYHMQMVMQCKGLEAAIGKLPSNYYYTFVQTTAPYGTFVLHIKPGSTKSMIYELGEKLFMKGIDRAVEYERTGKALCYPNNIIDLDSAISPYQLRAASDYITANLHPHELVII